MDFVSTERAMRDWLQTQTELLSLLSNDKRRIDVERPKFNPASSIVVFRVGGAPLRYVPMDRALLQFDCWAGTRGAALRLQEALCGVLYSMASTPLTEGVLGHDAEISSIVYAPGEAPGAERYVVTALVSATRRAVALTP
jgi:hypothetical protein